MRNCVIKLLLCLFLALLPSLSLAATLNFTITGVTGDALTNVQNRLQILKQNFGDSLSVEDVQSLYQKAPKNIQQALQPYGYFNSRIQSQLQHQGNQWQADFNISPGPALKIQRLVIEITGPGENDSHLKNYVQQFPLKTGQTFISPTYENAKKKLFNLALQEGYLTAYFVAQEVAVHVAKNTCTVMLILNTGPRFYFGPVSFSPSPLNDTFLQRYAPFQPGQPFSSEKLLTFQNLLSGSNYFQNVSIESNVEQAKNYQVPVYVNLVTRKKKQYLLGAGFGTDTGPRLTLGANWRYVNPNGHYINSQLMLSPVQSNLQASYVIPGSNPATDQYSLNANVMTNRLNQGDSTTEQAGASDLKLFSNGWQRTLALNYAIEQFKFNQQPGQTSHLLIPGISFTKTTYNDQLFPTQGNRVLISMQGSVQSDISDTSFFQTEIQDKFITHFTDNDRFILRGDAGYTAVHNIDLFPLSLRFYAGGSQSVRGFSYQALGPGRYLATGSAEFQQHITGKWYGAVFFDAGNAINTLDIPLQRSAGVGVVWASPVGTMELSLAQVQSLPDHPFRIQFVMGPDL